jgi:hypothetical protein
LKKAHLLRLRSIALLHRISKTPLIDFSRASHLDLFEQPEIRFFNNRLFEYPLRLCIVNLKLYLLRKKYRRWGKVSTQCGVCLPYNLQRPLR